MTTKIRKPAGWEKQTLDDIMQCDAGQAYVLEQLDVSSRAITPEHTFRSSRKNQDTASYEIYEDDSLWFSNNAEDEVWFNYRDFVEEQLLPGLRSQGLYWTEEERDAADDFYGWIIDDMDKKILILYCDGDEEAARQCFDVKSEI